MILKFIVTLFVLFAVSRVILRYRDGSMGIGGAVLWTLVWLGVEVLIWIPKTTDVFAQKIGIGRGADALLFFSIVALFYGLFRVYVKMENIEHEITSLVRAIALREAVQRQTTQIKTPQSYHSEQPPHDNISKVDPISNPGFTNPPQ